MPSFIDDDAIYRYIKNNWYDHGGYSDLNLFLNKGYLDLAVQSIVESGAIDPSTCYSTFKRVEEAIIKYYNSLDFNKVNKNAKECLKGVDVWVNDLNEHYFIDTSLYFVDESELLEWGFKKQVD